MSSNSRKESDKPKLRQSHSPQASTSASAGLSRQPNVPPVAQFVEQQPLPPPSVPPRRAGSMHTKVVQYPPPPGPPPTKPLQPSPPAYNAAHEDEIVLEDYREPELVANSPPSSVPELVDASQEMGWNTVGPTWDDTPPSQDWGQPSNLGSATGKDGFAGWGGGMDGQWVALDSGDHWWDRARLASDPKPGSGVAPPGLAIRLHPTSRTTAGSEDQNIIWRVSVSPVINLPVDEKLGEPTAKQPTPEQVLRSIPHPHALFRELDNAWVYYEFRQSLNLPANMVLRPAHAKPSASSSSSSPPSSDIPKTLPAQEQRREWVNCLDEKPRDARMNRWDRAPQAKDFRTHHFHQYPKSVRGSTLDPPFTRSAYLFPSSSSSSPNIDVSEENEVWLDVWVCCQCHAHIICSGAKDDSGIVPGVINPRVMRRLVNDRQSNPVPGTESVESVLFALETLARYVLSQSYGTRQVCFNPQTVAYTSCFRPHVSTAF